MKAVALFCLLHAMSPQASVQYSWEGMPTRASRIIRATTQNYHWEEPDGSTTSQTPGAACDIGPYSCACCAMVQEVNKLEEHFKPVLTELQRGYEDVNKSFHIINNNRVAFSACLYEADRLICEEPNAVSNIIKYQHVFLNLQDAYSETTGVFTVPYTGLYSITVTVYSDSGSSAITLNACATLQVNGVAVAGVRDRNKYDHEDSATIVVALQLQVGDEVSVRSSIGCLLCDEGRYNTFSAFLLHPTG